MGSSITPSNVDFHSIFSSVSDDKIFIIEVEAPFKMESPSFYRVSLPRFPFPPSLVLHFISCTSFCPMRLWVDDLILSMTDVVVEFGDKETLGQLANVKCLSFSSLYFPFFSKLPDVSPRHPGLQPDPSQPCRSG